MCELGLLFGHKLSYLKFEIHVVKHLSQERLQTRCQNINSSSSNALALKGDERWNSHCFFARYAQNTPTGFRLTHIRFAMGARVIYPPLSWRQGQRSAHKATCALRFILVFQTVKIGPLFATVCCCFFASHTERKL